MIVVSKLIAKLNCKILVCNIVKLINQEERDLNTDQFKEYLMKKYTNQRVISDVISRCKRVTKNEGDLDNHFHKDGGASLLDILTYSKRDALQGKDPKHSIIINGTKGHLSIYEGTLSLYHSVDLYLKYMKKI